MKYLTTVRFRLVDREANLGENEVYDPQDSNYEKTSRSMAAAIRVGWLKPITDAEADRLEAERVERLTKAAVVTSQPRQTEVKQPRAESRRIRDVEVATPEGGKPEMANEDVADEVMDQSAIIAARDARRNRASQTAKAEIVKTASSIREEIDNKVRKSLRIGSKRKRDK